MAPPAARCTWRPNPGRSNPAGVFYCPDPAAGGNEGGLTSDPDPSRPRTISSIPTSNPDPTGPDQRHGTTVPDPDPTDPDPTDPDFRPCSANPRPWAPSNRYRFEAERAATRKKLTPPD